VHYPYPGLSPSNVNKDAKYSVISSREGGWKVRLIYRSDEGEKSLLTIRRHRKLVAMVNNVKEELKGRLGGIFYINEFGHVLVPHPNGGCVYADTYHKPLKFDFNGQEIGPVPPAGLAPGDRWPGPHVGVPYQLIAGGTDMRCMVTSSQGTHKLHLSEAVGLDAARLLARRLATVKEHRGGRTYINEAGHFFAPINGVEGQVSYVYLGPLGDDAWFPAPRVPGRK
jgi:hypothetical protein